MNVEDFKALLKLLPMKDVYQYYFAVDEALCRLKGDKESWNDEALQKQFDLVFGDNRDKTE